MKKLLVVPCLMLSLSGVALAQDMSGLFSKEGVEIRADARVFTLFAMFNGLGYDHETARGPKPLQGPLYSPIRAALRVELVGKADAFKPMQEHLDRYSGGVDSYVEQVLRLGPAPDFSAPEDADEPLRELAGLLSAYYKSQGKDLFEAHRAGLREESKRWLKQVDALSDLARSTARVVEDEDALLEDEDLDETPRRVLIVNPLDSHGALLAIDTADARILVVGPIQESLSDASAEIVLSASLEAMLRPAIKRAAGQFGQAALLGAMATRGLPPGDHDPTLVLTGILVSGLRQQCLKKDLKPQAPSAGLTKGAVAALSWYGQQEQDFAALAPTLIAKILAIKVPEPAASPARSQAASQPASHRPASTTKGSE